MKLTDKQERILKYIVSKYPSYCRPVYIGRKLHSPWARSSWALSACRSLQSKGLLVSRSYSNGPSYFSGTEFKLNVDNEDAMYFYLKYKNE